MTHQEFDYLQYCKETEPEDEEDFPFDDSMDGDHDSAMASAGFGTDEDYTMWDDIDF